MIKDLMICTSHRYANTARSTIFFYDNASPTGMRDRSKVKKTVPAQVPLATSCGAGSKPLRGAMEINELFATAIALRQILPPG